MAKTKAVPEDYDTTRFVSALAQYNFNRMDVGTCHPEQGLNLEPRANPKDLKFFLDHLRDTVVYFQWNQFTGKQGKYSPHVALEFLVNINCPEREKQCEVANMYKSKCRGVVVEFSPQTINKFYGLPDYEGKDEYSRLLHMKDNVLNWRIIEWVLTRGHVPLERVKN